MEIFSTLFDIYFANRFEIITTKNSNLNNSLTASDGNKFDFDITEDGKPGFRWKVDGADTVIPFKASHNIQNLGKFKSNAIHQISLQEYPEYKDFTIENFVILNCRLVEISSSSSSCNHTDIIQSYDNETGILTLNWSVCWAGGKYQYYIEYTVGLIY